MAFSSEVLSPENKARMNMMPSPASSNPPRVRLRSGEGVDTFWELVLGLDLFRVVVFFLRFWAMKNLSGYVWIIARLYRRDFLLGGEQFTFQIDQFSKDLRFQVDLGGLRGLRGLSMR